MREMNVQLALAGTGITGWMFNTERSPSPLPPAPLSTLNWNGKLVTFATGFTSWFATSSSALPACA